MRKCRRGAVVVAIVVVFAAAMMFGSPTLAHARDFELSVAGGGTRLAIDEAGGEDVLNGQWGPWVAASFSLAPMADTPQFRLGAGVGFSWISGTIDNESITGDLDLFLITPEVLLSWRQPIGARGGEDARHTHWYLEPGVGVGPAIGALWFVGTEWGHGYSVRPFFRAGYQHEHWAAGLEASYQFGRLSFDGGDSDFQNLGVGLFASWRL